MNLSSLGGLSFVCVLFVHSTDAFTLIIIIRVFRELG